MGSKWLALGTALAVWAPGVVVQAAPLVQTVGGLTQTIGDFTPFDIAFLPFDPAQGTLASVTVRLIGTVVPTLFSDNITNVTGPVTLTTRLFAVPTNGFPATQTVDVNTQTGVALTLSSIPPSVFINGAAVPVDQTFTFTDAADFLGTSPVPVTLLEYGFRARTNPLVPGAGSDLTSFTGRAIVTYNLAAVAVPEPAAVLAFGAGLAGLGWMRRRRADG